MSWYKHSKLLMPSEKLATEDTVVKTLSNNFGHGTDKPSTMLTIWKWLSMIRLMVECNALRRRSALNFRNDRIRRRFNTKNNIQMPNTANTRIITLLPSSFDVLHGTHDDRLVREYPAAQDWHRRELLRKPKCIEQVEFNGEVDVTTVTSEVLSGAPGQAGGYRHSANDSVTAVVVLSSKGIFHHPNLGRMVLDTIGPAQSPPAIRNKKLETTQFETSTSTKKHLTFWAWLALPQRSIHCRIVQILRVFATLCCFPIEADTGGGTLVTLHPSRWAILARCTGTLILKCFF